jgi:methylphosphotriester-DNA--protein-cysteine methyltransferase
LKKTVISFSILWVVIFFLVLLSQAADYKYVGSTKSVQYHFPNCKWAQKINRADLVKFKSAKEAQEAGYVPCKICRPPTKDYK